MHGFIWRYIAAVLLGGGVAGGLYLYNKEEPESTELVAEVTENSQAIIPIEQPDPVVTAPEPVIVEPEPEPVVVEVTPEPVVEEPTPEPVVVAEPIPEPEIVEPEIVEAIEPVIAEPEPEDVVVLEPEPVTVEPVVEPVVAEPEPEPEIVEPVVEPEIVEAPEPEIAEPEPAEVAVVEPEPAIVEPIVVPVVVEPEPEPEVAEPVAEPEIIEVTEPVIAEPEPEDIVIIEPAPEPEPIAPSAEESDDEENPTFDVVRVDNSGAAVVAGTAMPNSTVSILSDGEKIGEATADSAGEFVAIVMTPESDTGQTIELEAELDGELQFSDESILILPPLDISAADNIEEEISPAIVLATPDEVVIIQPSTPLTVDQISIDSINYDDAGEVSVAGRGTPGAEVFLYVDGELMSNTAITESGNWKVELHNLTAGNYVMRADEMAPNGGVSSRMETPFQRAYPEDVREAQAQDAAPTYTVQPGNSLWVIATARYGEGTKYTQIFAANQEQIRDPDLIYPGQVFNLPEQE